MQRDRRKLSSDVGSSAASMCAQSDPSNGSIDSHLTLSRSIYLILDPGFPYETSPMEIVSYFFQYMEAKSVEQLDTHYDELKRAAQRRLGQLFNAADYPHSLVGWFAVSWEFPSIEPPDYLRQLSPQLFEQESRRMAARFEEAVQLAEQAFIDELSKLVSHLTERLTGDDDGKPKVFRDSAIENLSEFFGRFRHLNIRSSEQLDALVVQAQQVVRGVTPDQLRDNTSLRQQVATQLSGVQATLDGLLVDRPRRNLIRRPK